MDTAPLMWWLDVSSHPLLAVFCGDGKSDPFPRAKPFCNEFAIESECEYSTDMGDDKWSRCMLEAKLCFDTDNLRNYQGMRFGLATATSGIRAIGIGSNKLACERATHLGLAITHAQTKGGRYGKHLQALVEAAQHLRCLEPISEARRFDYSVNNSCAGARSACYSVAWHVARNHCEGEFFPTKADADQRFAQLMNGPYVVVLFDPQGNELEAKGRYNRKHWVRQQLRDWRSQKFSEHTSTSGASDVDKAVPTAATTGFRVPATLTSIKPLDSSESTMQASQPKLSKSGCVPCTFLCDVPSGGAAVEELQSTAKAVASQVLQQKAKSVPDGAPASESGDVKEVDINDVYHT